MTATAARTHVTTTNPWLPRPAVIREIRPETPGVLTYQIQESTKTRPDQYAFLPGQFNMLYLPGCGEVAISMSGRPTRTPEENCSGWLHTIRQVGQVTGAMARMKVGDALALRGPYGKPWPVGACKNGDVIVMAGGVGLAPLRPTVYELTARRHEYGRLILIYGARTPADLLYQNEYKEWTESGWEVYVTVDRGSACWKGSIGVVPLLLERIGLPRPQETFIFCCGPEVMMRYAALGALGRGIPTNNIWLSLERHMQCAVGLCGHCQLGTALICRDGPVFRWDQVQTLLTIHDL